MDPRDIPSSRREVAPIPNFFARLENRVQKPQSSSEMPPDLAFCETDSLGNLATDGHFVS
jgi:hypothetical protein